MKQPGTHRRSRFFVRSAGSVPLVFILCLGGVLAGGKILTLGRRLALGRSLLHCFLGHIHHLGDGIPILAPDYTGSSGTKLAKDGGF